MELEDILTKFYKKKYEENLHSTVNLYLLSMFKWVLFCFMYSTATLVTKAKGQA